MLYQDITILITSFKSDNKILDCLNSIDKNIKVLIIENSDNFKFKVKIEKTYPNCQCILAGSNLGYANGNNLGLSKIKTKYALILNPDAILEPSSIKNFFETAKKNPNFAIIGPLVQESKDVSINYVKNELVSVSNVKGFAMFLNLKEFSEIGFFDSNFFIYFEEIDLCRRVKTLNKEIYLDPTIEIYHLGGSSHDKEVNFEMELSRNWHWMWSTFYYQKKYNGFLIAFIKILPKLLSSFIKMIFFTLIFNRKKRAIYKQRFSGLFNSIIGKTSWYRPKVI